MMLLGIGIVALIRTDPGYMLLAHGNYTVESSLWVGVLLIVLFVLLLYGLISLIRKVVAGPNSLAGWLGARKARAAGHIPAVLYGHGETPLAVSVGARCMSAMTASNVPFCEA